MEGALHPRPCPSCVTWVGRDPWASWGNDGASRRWCWEGRVGPWKSLESAWHEVGAREVRVTMTRMLLILGLSLEWGGLVSSQARLRGQGL